MMPIHITGDVILRSPMVYLHSPETRIEISVRDLYSFKIMIALERVIARGYKKQAAGARPQVMEKDL
jgi:hypothetical protein